VTRTRSFIPWLLAVVAALIVYGSLYPFNFKPDAIEGGVLEALRQLSWARAGRGDRISNVLLYLPLGFCLFLWLDLRLRRGTALLVAVGLGSLLSLAIEVAQVYVSSRVPSLTDLSLNSAGSLIGAAGGLAWGALTQLMHLPTRAEQSGRDPGAVLVIVAWLAWRFAPFVPQLDLGKLKAALRPLFHPQIDPIAVFVFLTCWLVVNQAVAALASRARRLEFLLLLIAAVLVGRLLVASQAFVPAELLALLLLLPMVVLMHRLTPQPRRTALVLAVLTVVMIDGLAPFEFARSPGPFDLWPFKAWLGSGVAMAWRSIDWAGLFGKTFLFAAQLWVVKEWGASIRLSIGLLIATVLTIEVLQMWLPHQTASITDPLIAVAVCVLFRFCYRRQSAQLAAGFTSRQRVRSR
jgi:VanZ family protein